MVSRGGVGVVTALNYKCVGLTPNHIDFGDQQTIDIPGNSPTNVTCKVFFLKNTSEFVKIRQNASKYVKIRHNTPNMLKYVKYVKIRQNA